jgi:Histidine kinase-, DNA gyrase B-, and HSP90-like ATPase
VLVDNACRYAGTGGTVRIGVAHRGARVVLTVEDSGPGIPAEMRSRLFDRFHRSTDQGGSAGLGLAIADSIVRSTDGQWRVSDSELGGALFEVSWRRAGVRQATAPPAGGRSSRPGGREPAMRPVPPHRKASTTSTASASAVNSEYAPSDLPRSP